VTYRVLFPLISRVMLHQMYQVRFPPMYQVIYQGWERYNCNVLHVRSNKLYCKNKLQCIALSFTRIAIHFHSIIHIAIHFNCISLYCNTILLYSVFMAIGNVMLIIKWCDYITCNIKRLNLYTNTIYHYMINKTFLLYIIILCVLQYIFHVLQWNVLQNEICNTLQLLNPVLQLQCIATKGV